MHRGRLDRDSKDYAVIGFSLAIGTQKPATAGAGTLADFQPPVKTGGSLQMEGFVAWGATPPMCARHL